MSRPAMTDMLEIGLQLVETGRSLDEAVATATQGSPEQAGELRELLQLAVSVQPANGAARVPASAQIDSRRRFLLRAAAIQRPAGFAGLLWIGKRFFRANLGSLIIATSMVSLLVVALISMRALPGDGLYPVKLAAERAQVSLANSDATRLERMAGFDSRRAEEVATLIQMKRVGSVSFGGFLVNAKEDRWVAAGIPLQISTTLTPLASGLSGAYVEVQGDLQSQGVVQVKDITPRLYALNGKVEQVKDTQWVIDGQVVKSSAITHVTGNPEVGGQASLYVARLVDSTQVLAINGIFTRITPTPSPILNGSSEGNDTPEATATDEPKKAPLPENATPTVKPPESGGHDLLETPQPTHEGGDTSGEQHLSGSSISPGSDTGSGLDFGSGSGSDAGSGSDSGSSSGSGSSGDN